MKTRIPKIFFEVAAKEAVDCIYFLSPQRQILFWNKSAEILTGFKSREVIGKRCYDDILKHIDENGNNLCFGECPVVKAINSGKIQEANVFLHDKQGARLPVHVVVYPVKNKKGEVIGAVERFNVNLGTSLTLEGIRNLEKEAFLDPLTRVPNRRYVEKKLKEYLKNFRSRRKKFGILFIDLDNFKQINDTYGHLCGDRLLKAIGQTILMNIKPIDTIGRYGGDEFVVVLEDITKTKLKKFAEKLLKLIKNSSIKCDGKEIYVSASIGGTLVRNKDNQRSILKRADEYLLKAKSNKPSIQIGD
uniref:Diguanylate cyclase n=1 Tax=candidate division WOR-3 bacterium TaxID=2052148 RepID=A0A7C2K485_UNCW3